MLLSLSIGGVVKTGCGQNSALVLVRRLNQCEEEDRRCFPLHLLSVTLLNLQPQETALCCSTKKKSLKADLLGLLLNSTRKLILLSHNWIDSFTFSNSLDTGYWRLDTEIWLDFWGILSYIWAYFNSTIIGNSPWSFSDLCFVVGMTKGSIPGEKL